MNKYGHTGIIKAKPGKREELLDILLQAAHSMSRVKGCQKYIVGKDLANEQAIRVFEIWNSKEDHDNSLKAPESMELISKAIPIIDGKPEGYGLEIAGGLGA